MQIRHMSVAKRLACLQLELFVLFEQIGFVDHELQKGVPSEIINWGYEPSGTANGRYLKWTPNIGVNEFHGAGGQLDE